MSRCVVCEFPTSGSLEFCKKHFKEFEGEIKDKKPWVKELKNDAQRERRRAKKEYNNTSLDEIIDDEYQTNKGSNRIDWDRKGVRGR